MKYTGRTRDIFTDREIDLKLAAVRHRAYTDLDDILEADPNYVDLTPWQLRFLDGLTGQSDGIVMVRHAPPLTGRNDSPIFAELRPLDAVRTGTRRHNFTDKNGMLWDHHITVRTEAWKKHIARHDQPDDHYRVNNPEDHKHNTLAKYLFPPGKPMDRPWRGHDHTTYSTDRLLRHLENHEHPEGDETVHTSRGKDPKVNRAKRIDVHPWALDMMAEAETVYFVLEGCLKADSILTHIRRNKLKASVFSVPSVTLWGASELHAFVQQYLRDKLIIIVPDSDWEDPEKDGAVIAQSLYAREQLGLWLLPSAVHIAAPTAEPGYCANHDKPAGSKRGIDDYLADGEKLRDLPVIDRRAPAALRGWASPSGRSTGRARDTRLLEFIALHADETTGQFHAPLKTIEKRSGIDRKAVREALTNLVEAGAITSDKPLRTVDDVWIPWPFHNPYGAGWGVTGWAVNETAWYEVPTLTVGSAPLDFRATTLRAFTVGDLERPLGAYGATA